MMWRNRIYVLVLAAAVMAVVSPRNLTAQDSTMINALDYSMQKRYRPENEPFVNDKFADNTYVGIHAGIFGLSPREGNVYSSGLSFKVSGGKWLNEYNILRVSLFYGQYVRNRDRAWFHMPGLEFAHMFNLSSYFGGYKVRRLVEISTVEGISVGVPVSGRKVGFSAGLMLGLNATVRLSDRTDFFIEPYASIQTDGIDHFSNWHKYDFLYGASFGVNVNFNSSKSSFRPAARSMHRKDTWFMSASVGPQFQYSDIVKDQIGILRALGPNVAVSCGFWMHDVLALQMGLFYGSDIWIKDFYGNAFWTHYAGARVELRFDPLAYIPDWDEKSVFSLPLSFGPEIGYMYKDEKYGQAEDFYIGLTCAARLQFRIAAGLSIYLEPRFSLVPYHVDFESYDADSYMRNSYYDAPVNLSLGLEFKIPARQ